jgi:DNA-binding response OmpR family regulator
MPRILVVDDQKDVRVMICMVLRVNGFEVTEADGVKAGLKAFEAADFVAAVVDIFLKDENGFDLITALRERSPGLPVVAVSGMTILDAVVPRSELADVICLQKPFRPVELMQAIANARGPAGQGEDAVPSKLAI